MEVKVVYLEVMDDEIVECESYSVAEGFVFFRDSDGTAELAININLIERIIG